MDISEGDLAQVKKDEGAMYHEIIDNIETAIVKEEPIETVFIKCEMSNENNRLGGLEEDNKLLQVPNLCWTNGMHTNSFKEDVKPKVENTESSSSQKDGDFTMKLIDTEVMKKEEEYVDSPEYLSIDLDLVQCEIGQVKTEDDNIFYENVKIESVKEEPTDNEACLSSDMLAQDEDSNEEVQPGSSKESWKDFLKRVKKTNTDTFQCQVCSKTFSNSSNLVTHEIIHTREKPYNCEVCPKSFSKYSYLVRHERTHTGEKPFSCRLCSKSFSDCSYLIIHKRIHTGEKPFNCKVCSKSFSQSSDLARHEKIHTGEKPFNCKVCSKSFSQNSGLTRHVRIHTGEKPFSCKVCSKSFSLRKTLATHERIHSGEKSFNCIFCSKSFSRRISLSIHERTHTRGKPFDCKVCSRSFTYKSSLEKHEKIHDVLSTANSVPKFSVKIVAWNTK